MTDDKVIPLKRKVIPLKSKRANPTKADEWGDLLTALEIEVADHLSIADLNRLSRLLFGDRAGSGSIMLALRDPLEAHRLIRHVAGDDCLTSHHWNGKTGHLFTVAAQDDAGVIQESAPGKTMAMSMMAALARLQVLRKQPHNGAA